GSLARYGEMELFVPVTAFGLPEGVHPVSAEIMVCRESGEVLCGDLWNFPLEVTALDAEYANGIPPVFSAFGNERSDHGVEVAGISIDTHERLGSSRVVRVVQQTLSDPFCDEHFAVEGSLHDESGRLLVCAKD